MIRSIIILFASILISACSSTKTDDHKVAGQDSLQKDSLSDELNKEIRVFSLPAPLQIPSEIKKHNPKFYEDLLKPFNNNPDNIGTNFKKALNLGIYAVDLGYTTIYDQGQSAINYLASSIKLAEQLNINTSINAGLVERYKRNMNNKDSVNTLIIKSFAEINRSLSESNRQADAALILTGSFVEGVHLSTGIYEKNKSDLMINLIGQQKLFLDNLLEILPSYENEEIGKLIADLKELKTAYDAIEIKYNDSQDEKVKVIDSIKASDEQIKAIGAKIKSMRKEMIS